MQIICFDMQKQIILENMGYPSDEDGGKQVRTRSETIKEQETNN